MSSYTLTVAARAHIGGPKNKEQQDRVHIDMEHGIFAVLDGHGKQGGQFADAVIESFALTGQKGSKADLFMNAAHALLNKPHLRDGGCTATVLTINEESGLIIVSAVGDSDARIWVPQGAVSGYPLNVDHSATSESEFRRIKEDAIVKGLRFLYDGYATVGPAKDIFSRDIESGEFIKDPKGVYHNTVRGDWAAYIKSHSGLQLAVTRAFGDFEMQPYGLTSLATTEIWPLPRTGETLSIVIATDGFWDAVQYEAVGEIVRRPDLLGNAEAAADVLLEYGLAKGRESFGSNSDNIAVMIFYVSG